MVVLWLLVDNCLQKWKTGHVTIRLQSIEEKTYRLTNLKLLKASDIYQNKPYVCDWPGCHRSINILGLFSWAGSLYLKIIIKLLLE